MGRRVFMRAHQGSAHAKDAPSLPCASRWRCRAAAMVREPRRDRDRGGPDRRVSGPVYSTRYQPYRRDRRSPVDGRFDPRARSGLLAESRDDEFIMGYCVTSKRLQVSATCIFKAIASRIAETSRHGRYPPTLLAIGHPCLHNAIKAIVQARLYVQNPDDRNVPVFDLTCQPAFRENIGQRDRVLKPSLALYLNRIFDRQTSLSPKNSAQKADLTISSTGDPTHIAGALAARVREGATVALTAIGPDASGVAIRAICHARGYLEEDLMDIKCQPAYVTVEKQDKTLNAIRFHILPERL